MKRLAWATDIHLNFVSISMVDKFCDALLDVTPDAVIISGDIAEAPSVESFLQFLEGRLQLPIYFVLGNHDFYRGSIAQVRGAIFDLCKRSQWLHWLSDSRIVGLSDDTCLVGHDSWADGRFGHGCASTLTLNDFVLIDDFKGLDRPELFARLNALGDEAARYFRIILPRALARFRRVILVTHVPPFQEVSWYQGESSRDQCLPHFGCKAVGEALVEIAANHGEQQITVLCGHTHRASERRILPNLWVKAGAAEYGKPALNQILTV